MIQDSELEASKQQGLEFSLRRTSGEIMKSLRSLSCPKSTCYRQGKGQISPSDRFREHLYLYACVNFYQNTSFPLRLSSNIANRPLQLSQRQIVANNRGHPVGSCLRQRCLCGNSISLSTNACLKS